MVERLRFYRFDHLFIKGRDINIIARIIILTNIEILICIDW